MRISILSEWRYSLALIALYAILFPLFLVYTPTALRYGPDIDQPVWTVLIFFGTFPFLYFLNQILHWRTIRWQGASFSQFVSVVVYAVAFAVPEEIFFRGIIQHDLARLLPGIVLPVCVGALVFGLAHLPNRAMGIHPRLWNWPLFFVALFSGLPLGILFALSGSLFLPTLLHALLLISYRLFTEEYDSMKNI